MPEITRKRIGEIVRKVFAILSEHPEGIPAKDLIASTADSLNLPDHLNLAQSLN
jgi:hypothetical protein